MKHTCEECGKPAVFTAKGGHAHTDATHTLCKKHWRDKLNQSRSAEMKNGEVIRKQYG